MPQLPIILTIIIVLIVSVHTWATKRKAYLKTSVNETVNDRVVLAIEVPQNNDKSPLSAEQLLTSLYGIGLNKQKSMDHFSLEIAAGSHGIHFIVVVDRKYKTFFENQIYAQYPEAQIKEVQDYATSINSTESHVEIVELSLSRPNHLPIRTFRSFDVDPMSAVTASVSKLPPGQEVFMQILSRPVGDFWQEPAKNRVSARSDSKSTSDELTPADYKSAKLGFQFLIRILSKSSDATSAKIAINSLIAALGQYKTTNLNYLSTIGKKPTKKQRFKKRIEQILYGQRLADRLTILDKFIMRFLDENEYGVVNTEELASLFHLPSKSVETPDISWARSKKLEYPLNVPTKDARIIGVTDYRGINIHFGIRELDRLRHMYIVGKTGVGKSTFMEGMILSDIYDGNGVGIFDPHGETINLILEKIPQNRLNDVVIFDPGDTEHPIGINLLQTAEGEDKSLVADGIVSVFKKQYADSWGPRLEYILTNTILTLLNCQNVSLLAIPRILTEDNYRKFLLKQLKDPILLKFWNEEYSQLAKDPRRRDAEISSILNKVGRFTTNPMIRNIVGQVTSSFNIREIMDNKKILLVNLSQGKIGEENMALLGGMLITRIYSSAMQRVDQRVRTPFYLYVDEFQNFSNTTFQKILSEARKYGLSLTIAHQFLDQISEETSFSIFGNVGTIINFSIGPRDAEFLSRIYAPYLDINDLLNLGRHEIVAKLSIDETQSKPFTARTIKHNFPDTNLRKHIVEYSREKYSRTKSDMEQKILKWANQMYNKEGNLMTPEEILEMKEKKKHKYNNQNKAPNESIPQSIS